MKCSICGQPIVLKPNATERARKFGGKPSDYTRLFTSHAQCVIDKRDRDTKTLIQKMKGN